MLKRHLSCFLPHLAVRRRENHRHEDGYSDSGPSGITGLFSFFSPPIRISFDLCAPEFPSLRQVVDHDP
jgi:hypothetical protein